MTIYGYTRISTAKQSLKLQRDAIEKEYPTAQIFEEVFTGTKIERTVLDKLIAKVNTDIAKGKAVTVVFYSVSRMSRNADEGFKLYMDLYSKGVNLVFIKDSCINSDIYREATAQTIPTTGNEIADIYIEATNKVLQIIAKKQIFNAFAEAEKEVTDLHHRTSDGMRASGATNTKDEDGNVIQHGKIAMARKGQRYHSEKEYSAKFQILTQTKSFTGNKDDLKDNEMQQQLMITKSTYYRYKAELVQELSETDRDTLIAKYRKLLRDKRENKK